MVGLDEKGDGSSKRQRDDGATNQPPKKKRTLNGMFVAKRGGNMFECIHQLAKDEQERANNVDEGREKELTKRVERVRSSLNGFVRYKADCDTYNLAQEKNDSPERRNYWDVSHIPNQNIRKLFITTFGPEKSGILGKNKEIQVAYLTDREKMGISFTKLQVDAFS
jgi:hypothetical protein